MAKAKKKKEFKLKQTKGSFKVRGVVSGFDVDKHYNEGVLEKGAWEGRDYKSIKIPVVTSVNDEGEENKVWIELFGAEEDNIYAGYREGEGKNSKWITEAFDWTEKDDIPETHTLLGVRVNLNDGEAENLVKMDAVERMAEEINDGDSVYASGEIVYRSYVDKQGDKQMSKQFVIRSISKMKKDIDFENEKFKEMCSFDQEIVFVAKDKDRETGEMIVIAYIVNYGDKFEQVEFRIDPARSESVKKMAEQLFGKMKFGEQIKVTGVIANRVELIEDKSAPKDRVIWGEEAEGYGDSLIKRTISKLEITGADGSTHKKGKEAYKETDFVVEELIDNSDSNDSEDEEDDNIYGENDNNDNNGNDDSVEIDEEDLPF